MRHCVHGFNDGVKKVTKAFALLCGNAVRLAKAKGVKVIENVGFIVVQLVDCKDDWLVRLAEEVGDGLVIKGETCLSVHDVKDCVRCFHCNLNLGADVSPHLIFAFQFKTACVNHCENFATPLNVTIHSIAGDTRGVFNNGNTLANKAIEKG